MCVFGGVPPIDVWEMGNASGNRTETTSVSVILAIQGETRVKNVSIDACYNLHMLTKSSSNMYTQKVFDL